MNRPEAVRLVPLNHPPSQTCWQVVAESAGEFERSVLSALGRLDASALRIKSNRHRTLWFLPREGMFLKHHHPGRPVYRLRQWFEGVRGKREWDNHLALRELGVRVPQPVAWGRRTGFHESFFVTAGIAGSRTLSEYLSDTPRDDPAREAIIHSLATEVGTIHRRRWKMPDLHGENFLVAEGLLYLIDFHSARPSRSTRRSRVLEWGRLLASVGHLLSSQERTRLVGTYLHRQGDREDQNFLRQAVQAEVRHLRHQYRAALRRCSLEPGNRAGRPGGRIFLSPGIGVSPELLVSGPGLRPGEVLKRAPRTRVSRRALDGTLLVVKEYTDTGLKKRLRNRLSISRAEQAFRAMAGLKACKIAIPEPVACIAGPQGTDFLWTQFLEDSVALDRLLQNGWEQLPNDRRQALVLALAKLVGRLHRMGITHPDLTARNFLVGTGREPRVWLVDFDGVQLKARLSRSARIHNLAQLNDLATGVGRRDISVFMRTYVRVTGSDWMRNSLKRILVGSRRRRLRALQREDLQDLMKES